MAEQRPQFGSRIPKRRAAFVQETPVRFDIGGFRTDESIGHPVVNQRFDGVRRIVGFSTADQSVIRVDADQNQVGHDARRDGGFHGRDLWHDSRLISNGFGCVQQTTNIAEREQSTEHRVAGFSVFFTIKLWDVIRANRSGVTDIPQRTNRGRHVC